MPLSLPVELSCAVQTVVSRHMCTFKLIKIKQNQKISLSVALTTIQVLDNPVSLMATILDSTNKKQLHHCRKPSWTALEILSQRTSKEHLELCMTYIVW